MINSDLLRIGIALASSSLIISASSLKSIKLSGDMEGILEDGYSYIDPDYAVEEVNDGYSRSDGFIAREFNYDDLSKLVHLWPKMNYALSMNLSSVSDNQRYFQGASVVAASDLAKLEPASIAARELQYMLIELAHLSKFDLDANAYLRAYSQAFCIIADTVDACSFHMNGGTPVINAIKTQQEHADLFETYKTDTSVLRDGVLDLLSTVEKVVYGRNSYGLNYKNFAYNSSKFCQEEQSDLVSYVSKALKVQFV